MASRLTWFELAEFDDFLTASVVDSVYYWATIRKAYNQPNIDTSKALVAEQTLKLIRNHMVFPLDAEEAKSSISHRVNNVIEDFMRLEKVRKFLQRYPSEDKVIEFINHAKRYFQLYSYDCGFDVCATDRYMSKSGKLEACVIAKKVYQKNEEVKYLYGYLALLDENEVNSLDQNDFSIINISSKNSPCLMLGPTRFVNHDCDGNARFSSIRGGMTIIATRKILVGEEITVPYASSYFGKDNKDCLCATCERKGAGAYAEKPQLDLSNKEVLRVESEESEESDNDDIIVIDGISDEGQPFEDDDEEPDQEEENYSGKLEMNRGDEKNGENGNGDDNDEDDNDDNDNEIITDKDSGSETSVKQFYPTPESDNTHSTRAIYEILTDSDEEEDHDESEAEAESEEEAESEDEEHNAQEGGAAHIKIHGKAEAGDHEDGEEEGGEDDEDDEDDEGDDNEGDQYGDDEGGDQNDNEHGEDEDENDNEGENGVDQGHKNGHCLKADHTSHKQPKIKNESKGLISPVSMKDGCSPKGSEGLTVKKGHLALVSLNDFSSELPSKSKFARNGATDQNGGKADQQTDKKRTFSEGKGANETANCEKKGQTQYSSPENDSDNQKLNNIKVLNKGDATILSKDKGFEAYEDAGDDVEIVEIEDILEYEKQTNNSGKQTESGLDNGVDVSNTSSGISALEPGTTVRIRKADKIYTRVLRPRNKVKHVKQESTPKTTLDAFPIDDSPDTFKDELKKVNAYTGKNPNLYEISQRKIFKTLQKLYNKRYYDPEFQKNHDIFDCYNCGCYFEFDQETFNKRDYRLKPSKHVPPGYSSPEKSIDWLYCPRCLRHYKVFKLAWPCTKVDLTITADFECMRQFLTFWPVSRQKVEVIEENSVNNKSNNGVTEARGFNYYDMNNYITKAFEESFDSKNALAREKLGNVDDILGNIDDLKLSLRLAFHSGSSNANLVVPLRVFRLPFSLAQKLKNEWIEQHEAYVSLLDASKQTPKLVLKNPLPKAVKPGSKNTSCQASIASATKPTTTHTGKLRSIKLNLKAPDAPKSAITNDTATAKDADIHIKSVTRAKSARLMLAGPEDILKDGWKETGNGASVDFKTVSKSKKALTSKKEKSLKNGDKDISEKSSRKRKRKKYKAYKSHKAKLLKAVSASSLAPQPSSLQNIVQDKIQKSSFNRKDDQKKNNIDKCSKKSRKSERSKSATNRRIDFNDINENIPLGSFGSRDGAYEKNVGLNENESDSDLEIVSIIKNNNDRDRSYNYESEADGSTIHDPHGTSPQETYYDAYGSDGSEDYENPNFDYNVVVKPIGSYKSEEGKTFDYFEIDD